VAFYRKYVVLGAEQADVLALWTAHTHALPAAEATPYIQITSPEKSSGKTRTLEVAEKLAHRAWLTGRMSPAALVRKVASDRPALLFDEVDAAFKSGEEFAEAVRGILNTGYRSSGRVSLCVPPSNAVKDFPTFCPKMFSGIGRSLPDTVVSRSIVIRLKRRARGERVERLRERAAWRESKPLRDSLARWAQQHIESLRTAEPDLPDELDDRAQDVWEPLLAIAEAAGGDWSARARRAAVVLSSGTGREDDSLGVHLLADIREVLAARDRITTKELIAGLVADEEGPWCAYGKKGDPITPRALADVLRPFGIESRSIRLDDGKTPKGYLAEQFADPFARYLPVSPFSSATPPQANNDGPQVDVS
jgi:hypothetical protein